MLLITVDWRKLGDIMIQINPLANVQQRYKSAENTTGLNFGKFLAPGDQERLQKLFDTNKDLITNDLLLETLNEDGDFQQQVKRYKIGRPKEVEATINLQEYKGKQYLTMTVLLPAGCVQWAFLYLMGVAEDGQSLVPGETPKDINPMDVIKNGKNLGRLSNLVLDFENRELRPAKKQQP